MYAVHLMRKVYEQTMRMAIPSINMDVLRPRIRAVLQG
jgi:hypothetical protein